VDIKNLKMKEKYRKKRKSAKVIKKKPKAIMKFKFKKMEVLKNNSLNLHVNKRKIKNKSLKLL